MQNISAENISKIFEQFQNCRKSPEKYSQIAGRLFCAFPPVVRQRERGDMRLVQNFSTGTRTLSYRRSLKLFLYVHLLQLCLFFFEKTYFLEKPQTLFGEAWNKFSSRKFFGQPPQTIFGQPQIMFGLLKLFLGNLKLCIFGQPAKNSERSDFLLWKCRHSGEVTPLPFDGLQPSDFTNFAPVTDHKIPVTRSQDHRSQITDHNIPVTDHKITAHSSQLTDHKITRYQITDPR